MYVWRDAHYCGCGGKLGSNAPSPFFQRLLHCSSRHELWTLERVHKIGDRFSMILKPRLFSGNIRNASARLGEVLFFAEFQKEKHIASSVVCVGVSVVPARL